MSSLFEAYITNIGKYNEGELVGETLKFPTTTEEVQALLKRIGVDGIRYQEFFITSFDGDVLGLYEYLTEYENLDELNHLACLLAEMSQAEREKFEAVIDGGEHTSDVKDLINLTYNLDNYDFYPDIDDEEALGRLYLQEFGAIPVPEELVNYIDYEAYGRDVRINENGHFAPGGYVRGSGGMFTEVYHGVQDIPEEHKVFALPRLTIREQMAAYQEIIDGSSLEGYRKITQREHEGRKKGGSRIDVTLTARLVNADKVREGEVAEIGVTFPTTKAAMREALKAIGVDGIRCREVFFMEHDSNLSGVCHCFNQGDPADELNYLCHLLSDLTDMELATFQAVVEYGAHNENAAALINLALNIESYDFYLGVDNDKE